MKLYYIIFLNFLNFNTQYHIQQLIQNHFLQKNLKHIFLKYNKKNNKLNNQIITSIERIKKSNIIFNNNTYHNTYPNNQETKFLSENFYKNKKKLPWPIKHGIIISKFGPQPHPIIPNIIINNSGIEFATYKGATAHTVFSGEIFKIQSIPGGNKAVIIKHGEYFTIYTNLKDVFVKVGEKVNIKKKLGQIYTDENGNTLTQFQIWKGSNNINPSYWLINE